MGKSRQARMREFTQKGRQHIKERDGGCIFCMRGYHMEQATPYGTSNMQIMHYIPRSQGGLGIPENGAVSCIYHHGMMDNGNKGHRAEMLGIFREHLKEHHPGWDEQKLTYSKWNY